MSTCLNSRNGTIVTILSLAVGFLGPCGLNTPHTHPRATELNYVVNGTLRTGFLMENGARFVFNEAHAGTVSVFPQGAIHFEQNTGCGMSLFSLSVLNGVAYSD